MRSEWIAVAREVLLDRRARERGVLRPAAVEQLIEEHRVGMRQAGDALWALINLELWYRTFIDGDGVQVLHTPGGDSLPDTVAQPRIAEHATSEAAPPPAAAASRKKTA
jgi:hypothetical protein